MPSQDWSNGFFFCKNSTWKSLIENQVADHLSGLKGQIEESHEIRGAFIDEQLLVISNIQWYANFANYLAAWVVPPKVTSHKLKKFFHDLKYYYWDDLYLFKLGAYQIWRWCIAKEEMPAILKACHTAPCGGHFAGAKTIAKKFKAFFRSTTWNIGSLQLITPKLMDMLSFQITR